MPRAERGNERQCRSCAANRPARLQDELMAIGRRCAALPETDARSAGEIIGYDRFGVSR
jgi:antitoxin VapB